MPAPYPRIPYGEADFKRIRVNGWLYVDKTRFVHALEEERYAFLIRPRRMGKSCWISLLAYYYDRTRAGEFEAVFGGTDLGLRPTQDRHRYVVLRFNFSAFDDTLDTLRERFETYCHLMVRNALERNRDLFPERETERILSQPSIDAKLNELFLYAGDRGIPLYVLIDEYDNFANTVLAHHGTPRPTNPSLMAAASTAISSPPSRPGPGRTRAAWSACSSPGCRRSPWTT